MKNKLLLVLVMFVVGILGTTEVLAGCYDRDPAPVDVIDYEIVARQCVKELTEGDAHNASVSERTLIYYKEYLTPEDYARECSRKEADEDYDFEPERWSYNTLVGYWVNKSVTQGVAPNLRRVFSVSGGLKLITFDPMDIDLYGEEELGWLGEEEKNQYTKIYGIRPAYSDRGGPLGTASGPKYINYYEGSRTTFFVCRKHSICGEPGCSNFTASSGHTYEYPGILALQPGNLKLNKYCPEDHACGFFWVTCNTNNERELQSEVIITYVTGTVYKTHEYLECIEEKRVEDGYFCEGHTCDAPGCDKKYPIIGVNIHDGMIKEPTIYEGEKPELYSNFCMRHFCWERFCRNARSNPDFGDVTKEEETGYCLEFPEYCSDAYYPFHYNDCTKEGCNQPVYDKDRKNDKANGYRYLCPTHMEEEVSMLTCSLCGKEMQSGNTISVGQPGAGATVCDVCLHTMGKNGYIDVAMENGEIARIWVDDGLKDVPASGNQTTGGNGVTQAGNGGNNGGSNSGTTGGNLSTGTCSCSEYPVPTSVSFQNLSATQHKQSWSCSNCWTALTETYNHAFIGGRCVCGATAL